MGAALAQSVDELASQAARDGFVPVIIEMNLDTFPGGWDPAPLTEAQRTSIQQQSMALIDRHSGVGLQNIKTYRNQPFVAARVNAATLRALNTDQGVRAIHADALSEPLLDVSAQQIGAPAVWNTGITGAGTSVAILDTGIDADHPMFENQIAQEVCFSTNFTDEDGNVLSESLCPDQESSAVGPGAAPDCIDAAGCGHGTHVAGIAAGSSDFVDGVAFGADIIAMQVFSRVSASECGGDTDCVLSFSSDQMLALDWLLENGQQYNLAAANMSLGGGFNTQPCDANPLKPVIDQLRSAGVATIIASGNDGYRNALSAPACISSAVSVGAVFTQTNDFPADEIVSFSNSAAFLDLLAPGVLIASAYLDGEYSRLSGTSMAAPHVAGAWALYRSAEPEAGVDEVLQRLQETGRPIRDPRNGVITSRIQVDNALLGTAPSLVLSPTNLFVERPQFSYSQEQITIENDGNTTLYWNAVPRSNTENGTAPDSVFQSPGVIYPDPSLGYDPLTVPNGRHGLGYMPSLSNGARVLFDPLATPDADAPLHFGLNFQTIFDSAEGYIPGPLIGQMGWGNIPPGPPETTGVAIGSENPYFGDQHVIMQFDSDYDTGTFIGAETPWFGNMSEGIFTFSAQVLITDTGGADYTFWSVTPNRQFPMRLDYMGRILVSDGFFFYNSGVQWTPGQYKEVRVEANTFESTVTFFYDDSQIAQFQVNDLKGISLVSMMHDNWQDGDVAYVDDFKLSAEQVKRDWLMVDGPSSGVLQPGESTQTAAAFWTGELEPGSYTGQVMFVTNDPAPATDRVTAQVLVTADEETSYPVTFNVDMSETGGIFNPEVHDVYVSGTFLGWDQPGTNPEARLVPLDSLSMIYTLTLDLPQGHHEYKYFLVEDEPTWELGEWEDGNNRQLYVEGPTTLDDVFGIDPVAVAYVQIIHNAADIDAASVDIWVNGQLALSDFSFREATPFLEMPGNTELLIEIFPAGVDKDMIPVFSVGGVVFEPFNHYRVIANGLLGEGYAPNPNDIDTSFSLFVEEDGQNRGSMVHLWHGSTDAPGVDFWIQDGPVLSTEFRYTDSATFEQVPAEFFILNMGLEGSAQTGDYLAQYALPLDQYGQSPVSILASGFMDPQANKGGSGFELLLVTEWGEVLTLQEYQPADVSLYAVISDNPVGLGEMFEVEIYAGSAENPVADLAGLGFQLYLAPWLAYLDEITPGEFMFEDAEADDVVSFSFVPEDSSYVALSFSRAEEAGGVSGSGLVATLSFTADTFEGMWRYFFTDILATDSEGNPLSVETFADFLVIADIVEVWPGDTNNDGIVDITDVLPIATYFGEVGPSREFNIRWEAQSASSWDNPALTYVNATGSGVITQNDVIPIGLNFGKTRPDYSPARAPMAKAMAFAPATLTIPAGFQSPNFQALITIEGDERLPYLLGAAADFSFDRGISVQESQPGLLLQTEQMLSFDHGYGRDSGLYSVAMSRLNNEGAVDAEGEVFQLTFGLEQVPAYDMQVRLDRLVLSGPDGRTISADNFRFDSFELTSVEPLTERPTSFELRQNYPNPFNPSTSIAYTLAESGDVLLEVYDMLGRRIATLVNTTQQPGQYTVSFDASGLATGTYLYRLQTGSFEQTRTMMLLK